MEPIPHLDYSLLEADTGECSVERRAVGVGNREFKSLRGWPSREEAWGPQADGNLTMPLLDNVEFLESKLRCAELTSNVA